MAENYGVHLNEIPKLKLRASRVTESWESWRVEFEIAIEWAVLSMGVETVEGREVNRLRGRLKLLFLLSAVGHDGMETLRSLGFNMDNAEDDGYDKALLLLRNHYEIEESMLVKTLKFVTVAQASGEDGRNYLLRVARLSRDVGFGTNEKLRQQFAVALAVEGLSDASLRKKCLQEIELTWTKLSDTVRAYQRVWQYNLGS